MQGHYTKKSPLAEQELQQIGDLAIKLLRGVSVAAVFDVAKYILEKQGRMSTWKLQKLCYYSQAWSLAWTDISKQMHDRGKSKHHYLDDVEKLSGDAKDRLKVLDIEDMVGNLFCFAFTNMLRVVGLRLEDNFYVLWYDPNHEVYPVKR